MSFATTRRALLALALVMPVSAAHPTQPAAAAPAAADGFGGQFAAYTALPARPQPGPGAVDIATIDHTHGDADSADEGESARVLGGGTASYYARKFHGRRTSSGERFDMNALTAAHRTLPFGSRVRVTNQANGRSVVVRINDRGPFHGSRLIDVSHEAAERLGLIARGHGSVELALLD